MCSQHRCQVCLLRRWSQQLLSDPGAGWRGEQPGWTGKRGLETGLAYGPSTCLPTSEICRPHSDSLVLFLPSSGVSFLSTHRQRN